jgi:hypothetical protein
MQSPARKVNVALAACALAAGFCATFGLVSVLRGGHDTSARNAGSGTLVAPADPSARQDPARAAGGQPSPAALDAQWLSYSDHSTCADWAGGDGVSAVRLNSSQIAWFFADTYLGPAGPTTGFSHLSGFLHNSVVVQTAAGPGSRLVTLTGGDACTSAGDPAAGPPQSVVQPPDAATGQRDWDADGLRVGSTVVKFYNTYLPGPIPYIPVGTTIASFPVGQLSAAGRGPAYGGVLRPELTKVPAYTPPGGGTPIVWGSAVLAVGSTVYVYGWQSPNPDSALRELYLARASAERLTDFATWQFYSAGQWVGRQNLASPIEPSGPDGQSQSPDVSSGFSVVHIAGRYWLIQADGAGDPDIDAYPAPAPWGPFDWAHGITLYRAPGIGLSPADDYRILYEARAEPALSTSQTLVISYNVNSEAVTAACDSITHYTNAMSQPRFIAVPKSDFGPARSRTRPVVAAPPDYPAITQANPAAWSSAWSYSGGCPPVPALSGVTGSATTSVTDRGVAHLTWPSAGLGLKYRVYLLNASGSYVRVTTVWRPRATVTGLSPGTTYQFQVVPTNIYDNTGPPAYAAVQIP